MAASRVNTNRNDRFEVGGAYAHYVLALLTLIVIVSMVDRQIVTILAGDMKAHFRLSDAELGLLYGTVFSVFYALFAIPLGRLADGWHRTRLLSLGLFGWSVMTMLSGLAPGAGGFAAARAGVAVGEASANPAAYSLLSDWFPKARRATVLAIYTCGVPLGIGASVMIGGAVTDLWNAHLAAGGRSFGLAGWQAAFVVISLPGFALAALFATTREPPRGMSEGVIQANQPQVFRKAGFDLVAILPLLSLFFLFRVRASRREWAINLGALVAIATGVALLTALTSAMVPPVTLRTFFTIGPVAITGHGLQWMTMGLGAFVVVAWVRALRLTDTPAYRMLWRCNTVLSLTAATALFQTVNSGWLAFSAFYAITRFDVPMAEMGLWFGAISALAGLTGTFAGGWLADVLRRYTERGRLYVTLLGMTVPWPIAYFTFSAKDLGDFYRLFFALAVVTALWAPGVISTCQDLVMPRMRGMMTATFNLAGTMFGLGAGPFLVGLIGDASGSIRTGLLGVYWILPLVWLCMGIAIVTLPRSEATRLERARAAGERV